MSTQSPDSYSKTSLNQVDYKIRDHLEKLSSAWNTSQPVYNSSFISKLFRLTFAQLTNIQANSSYLLSTNILDKYLWPVYTENPSDKQLVLLLTLLFNYKYSQLGFFFLEWSRGFTENTNSSSLEKYNVTGFQTLINTVCSNLFEIVSSPLNESSNITSILFHRLILVKFITNCSNNIEIHAIRSNILNIVSIGIWSNITDNTTRKFIFKSNPILKKLWKIFLKKCESLDDSAHKWIPDLIYSLTNDFILVLYSITNSNDEYKILYCENFIEFISSLLSQLATRRLSKALESLIFFQDFPVDDFTGKPLTDSEIESTYYNEMQNLQVKLFTNFKDNSVIQNLAIVSISKFSDIDYIRSSLNTLSDHELFEIYQIAVDQKVFALSTCSTFADEFKRNFVVNLLVKKFCIPKSQLKEVLNMPIYPNESQLFDDHIVSEELQDNSALDGFLRPLVLPKLNLHFLTLYDYLLRNYTLYRLESSFQIKLDIEDVLSRMNPQLISDYAEYDMQKHEVVFSGWSRMATTIKTSTIAEISLPLVGKHHPALVRGLIEIDIDQFTLQIRREWDLSLKPLDDVFLIWICPATESRFQLYKEKFNIFIRGCQIEALIGQDDKKLDINHHMSNLNDQDTSLKISSINVLFDPVQYKYDVDNGLENIYSSFNLIVRRKAKENNFKSVLSSIIQLMQSSNHVPLWLYNTFLGFGDPLLSSSRNTLNSLPEFIDTHNTFSDISHLKDTFPQYNISSNDDTDLNHILPPYSIQFTSSTNEIPKTLKVKTQSKPKLQHIIDSDITKTSINFTAKQADAIVSSLNLGLTLIVGPPGSGKTDVAVQIIHNLYHNFPQQKTLLITHSNQALNQLFEKILYLDIDQRHLLRLGHGEEDLSSIERFSKSGRVDSFLDRRTELLGKVDSLAKSLNISGDVGYTCETAKYFFISQITYRWNHYINSINTDSMKSQTFSKSHFVDIFPFANFFKEYLESLLEAEFSFQELMEQSISLYSTIETMFEELDMIRPFELLRSYSDRSNYLLLNEARIIAMTCTHGAMKRNDFAELGFTYDNVIIEESAQILEIEAFIPLCLSSSSKKSKIKRVIMIGDHHQLPPVVKNTELRNLSNFEQSMFTRFIMLGVPSINLDMQGRCRPEIADLFRWCYPNLNDLPFLSTSNEFISRNAGFKFNYQMINVEAANGKGETEPSKYFYQNLDEAEYAVAIYQYMRLIGYPLETIAILTTYNGQKELILDILNLRCKSNSLFGLPTVSTIDQYQGMQKDYVILSLVRTKSVGHIRDLRRLIVCLSRARLGLYVLCKSSIFLQSPEIKYSFEILNKRSQKLGIILNEKYSKSTFYIDNAAEDAKESKFFDNIDQFGDFVYEKTILASNNSS
ncbi:hypothetical protein BB561_005611 [Smittium simulii]|uniref:Pre-mRNA-splicing factor n=1 Tax=Smittium simulii TaxID=133385 RepID=A0A2T9Y9K7_9FUNG|nr:hypothetical protein BB561_005611 [Smittium simulii]